MQQQQATILDDIDSVVNRFEAVTPDHPFYVNFEGLRGIFQEKQILRALNVKASKGTYAFTNAKNYDNKTLLFLAGMRGSGKTSELSRYAKNLNKPNCFFVITCNIDQGLDMDRVEYMDILIFQLEKLLERAATAHLSIDDSILKSMLAWFQTIQTDINKKLKAEGSAEISIGAKHDTKFSITSIILEQLLGISASIRGGLTGSAERADSIRTTVRNNFSDFALKFNTFAEQVNEQLRKEEKANEILFIVDGLEKTMSTALRRKIIMEESNRISKIKVNTIFTLPVELSKERRSINHFATVISFPFVKLINKDGARVNEAYDKFTEMIEKRVALNLFENKATIDRIITLSGGSPRQLLQIIEQAAWQADEDKGIITLDDVNTACFNLGTQLSLALGKEVFVLLKNLKECLERNEQIDDSDLVYTLLEDGIIFEYNNLTYKRVNPLMELAELYQQEVLNK
jgi:hypothetical protein